MTKIENINEVSNTEEITKQKDESDWKESKKITESTKTIKTSIKEDRDQILFDEWKECRNAIEKYGEFVHSIRKYGFTIITGLLTANAYLFIRLQGFQPMERFLLSSSLSILIFGLFITDMYYLVLIRASVFRAIEIELDTDWSYEYVITLTATIHDKARQTCIDSFSILVYICFIFISMLPSIFMGGIVFIISIVILPLLIAIIILLYIHFFTKNESEMQGLIQEWQRYKKLLEKQNRKRKWEKYKMNSNHSR